MAYQIPKEEYIDRINSTGRYKFISFHGEFKNSKSRANVECLKCGLRWDACIHYLAAGISGCRACAKKRRWTAEERIEQINSTGRAEFVSWFGNYSGCDSKANLRCAKDGLEWVASVGNVVNHGSGCPSCGGVRRYTDAEIIEKINSTENIEFISWQCGYKNQNSKANVRCKKDGFEWKASVNNLTMNKRGCPACARTGYDPSKTAYLYALRSDCGSYIKIGITNKPKQRHSQLLRSTPFTFSRIGIICGDGVDIASIERKLLSDNESASLKGFNGCTEWLKVTDRLMIEMMKVGL